MPDWQSLSAEQMEATYNLRISVPDTEQKLGNGSAFTQTALVAPCLTGRPSPVQRSDVWSLPCLPHAMLFQARHGRRATAARNVGLYGQLRTMLADSSYTSLSIKMPVLDGTAKLGDYLAGISGRR